jgi:hypothetical protein
MKGTGVLTRKVGTAKFSTRLFREKHGKEASFPRKK